MGRPKRQSKQWGEYSWGYLTPKYGALNSGYGNADYGTGVKSDYITMQATDEAGNPVYQKRRIEEIKSAWKVRQTNPVYYEFNFRKRYPGINGKHGRK